MIVMKFGGSSLESAEAIERVCEIIASRREKRPIVVVSAIGKTTNQLLHAAFAAKHARRDEALTLIDRVRHEHLGIVEALTEENAKREVLAHLHLCFDELAEILKGICILGELTPRSIDAISSYGERLSAPIVASTLLRKGTPAEAIDSRDYIVTDSRFTQAQPKMAETEKRLSTLSHKVEEKVPVLGGFIAATEDGTTTTLGRGGSDFTAAIIGASVHADEIQIWTDVDGMLTSDPQMIPEAHRIRTISFAEASELAYFGARVLHPSTLLPAIHKEIPVRVLNSRRPEVEGTAIVSETVSCENPVKAIAFKRDITVVNVHSTRMLMAHGFLHRIFEVFNRYETPVDIVCTSEVSVSLTIDNTQHLKSIWKDLESFSMVSAEEKNAVVAVVGDHIRLTPGVSGRALGSLQHINVKMISMGASLLNLSLVIEDSDLEEAVRSLHKEFFRELDESVFAK
jgi:aspartate kinase